MGYSSDIKIKALKMLKEKEILTSQEYQKCLRALNLKEFKETKDIADLDDIIWNNKYVRVTYKGIKICGNFYALKMLVENKTEKELTLKACNMSVNGIIFRSSEIIINDLPAHRKICEHASIMFNEMREIGIRKISEMNDLQLKLECVFDYETIMKSGIIKLSSVEYMMGNYKN